MMSRKLSYRLSREAGGEHKPKLLPKKSIAADFSRAQHQQYLTKTEEIMLLQIVIFIKHTCMHIAFFVILT